MCENKIRVRIRKNSVAETLLPTLYAKCYAMNRWHGLFFDNDCHRIMESLDYDFSRFSKRDGTFAMEMGAFSAAARQFAFAAEIRDYLITHPYADVVLLGCGLDTVGHQADNGKCRFVNIDLPDVIALRERVLPSGGREKNIAADVFSLEWADEMVYEADRVAYKEDEREAERGAVFIASGLFLYHSRRDVVRFVRAMASRFEGARLAFDAQNKRGCITARKALRASGMGAKPQFYLDDPKKEIEAWKFGHKKISCKRMVSDYRRPDGHFPFAVRLAVEYSERNRMAQINVIDF